VTDPFAVEQESSSQERQYDGDMDAPFASPDEMVAGGEMVPFPPIDALSGRLVAVVPRKFDPAAPVSTYLQQTYNLAPTREEWRVDLAVLDGGELRYSYRSKTEGTEDDYEEREHVVAADDLPFFVHNWRVTWANVIGRINKMPAHRAMLLGRFRPGYSAKEMFAGRTFADFAAEMEAWEEKARVNPRAAGQAPRAKWHLDLTVSDADRALASEWWRQARAGGYTI
jgi:hypothetical protein